ncbi:septation ring formation regulator EzrA [Exiguobacterium flavidum]|uniref:septation ring formation regulator EzrA n=1 Tax=Exiguobacterium flavidum TaxID=2184695 RepID=UPI000DF7B86E|nr:septation ring formation regulator EzrA [Exiguobacterium flavidum]
MLYVVIGVIVIVLLVMLMSMISRKTYYRRIDELDMRKQGVVSASVPQELQELKQLPMAGETETKFTAWHEAWEELLTVHVAQIDETLYRTEEGLDRYRFFAVKSDLDVTEQLIADLEGLISGMLREMHAFKMKQSELSELQTQGEKEVAQLRKMLLLQSSSFGPALPALESQLEETDELRLKMLSLQQAGEVTEAHQSSESLGNNVAMLRQMTETLPKHWKMLSLELRQRIDQLGAGYKEMTLDGYPLEALGLHGEIKRLGERRLELVNRYELLDLPGFEGDVEQLAADVDQMYDMFRHEVEARHFVKKEHKELKQKALRMRDKVRQLSAEVETLLKSYEVSTELGDHFEMIERDTESLEGYTNDIEVAIREQLIPYTMLQDKMREAIRLEEQLVLQVERFIIEIETLRKDETDVRQKITAWRRLLASAKHQLKKLSMPKVPDDLSESIAESSASLIQLEQRFEETPFNVQQIVSQSADVEGTFRLLEERLDKVMFDVVYAERLVQYANRYRKRDNEVHMSLTIAESKFLAGDYKRTILLAERVLEEFDPAAIERIKEQYAGDSNN